MIDDLDRLRDAIRANAASVVCSLLGEPNKAMSRPGNLRHRNKGSFATDLLTGVWFDHETGEGGNLFDLIMRERHCDFSTAVDIAADLIRHPITPAPASRPNIKTQVRHFDMVDVIWRETVPIAGTLAEQYLKGRGLKVLHDINDLRFHSACPRGSDRLPAMVAAFRDIHSDKLCGLHRTYLTPNAVKVEGQAKMMLGRVANAAIKLSPSEQVETGLHVAEGVESALALLGFELAPAWALGSAGAILNFPVLAGIEALTIAVDQDDAGRKSSAACGERWRAAGREVRFVRAPDEGADLADLAKAANL